MVPGGLRATGTAASVDGPTVRGLPGWVGPAVVGAAALGVCASTAFLNPYAGQTPPCPLYALTGLSCPVCGASRAVWSLTHGDVAAAFARNPLLVLVLPVLAWMWAGWTMDAVGGPHLRRVDLNRTAGVILGAVVVAFGVARNLPWAPFHLLGPG